MKDARTYQRQIDEQYPDGWEGARTGAHLSRFLALAGYRGREGIVDSKWHLLRRIVAFNISIFCDFNESEGRQGSGITL